MTSKSRQLMWDYFIQKKSHNIKCFVCCEEVISLKTFHRGHIIAEAFGGTMRFDNLIPICSFCNTSMGTKTPTEYAEEKGYTIKRTDRIIKKEGLLIYKTKSDIDIDKHDYQTLQRLCIYNGVKANIMKTDMIDTLKNLKNGIEPNKKILKNFKKVEVEVKIYELDSCCKCIIL